MADDAREIRQMLQDRCDAWLMHLFPGVPIRRPTMTVKNPTRADRSAGSFVIWTTGASRGGYRDYATNQSGDIIDLGAMVHNKEGDKRFAFDLARDFLGLKTMTPAQRQAAKKRATEQEKIARAVEARAAQEKRVRAGRMFREAKSLDAAGGIVLNYLASRGLPPDLLAQTAHLEGDLRCAPSLEWWRGAEWRDNRKVRSGPRFPAMVAAVRNRAGDVTAVHCTFLRRDGAGKADVENPKLMFGEVRGSVIRIARGRHNETPEEAALSGRRTILVVTEGVEDALSVALALPEARVWAATSLGNLGNVPVDHACVGRVVVAADNDWQTPKAIEAFERAIEQLQLTGIAISVMRAHDGKDFNDLLKAV
jgi:hypothetical protein